MNDIRKDKYNMIRVLTFAPAITDGTSFYRLGGVLPYLEKAYELQPDNDAAKKTLMSVYNALEMTDKYKALKAKQ
jgi:hypothetical protein